MFPDSGFVFMFPVFTSQMLRSASAVLSSFIHEGMWNLNENTLKQSKSTFKTRLKLAIITVIFFALSWFSWNDSVDKFTNHLTKHQNPNKDKPENYIWRKVPFTTHKNKTRETVHQPNKVIDLIPSTQSLKTNISLHQENLWTQSAIQRKPTKRNTPNIKAPSLSLSLHHKMSF